MQPARTSTCTAPALQAHTHAHTPLLLHLAHCTRCYVTVTTHVNFTMTIGRPFHVVAGDMFCGCSLFHHYKPNPRDASTAMREMLLPAALRAAQICRYLVYSEADFEVSRPAGATRCTDGGEIWQGGGDPRSPPRAKFHPHRCNDKGVGPPKLKFLLRFDRNVEYKRPAGAYPLSDFHKICRVCTSRQDALGVKI